MDQLLKELSNMDDTQKDQLKALGMDPSMMEMSMKMMRDNPNIMRSAQKMMEKMSPQELAESSRVAQQQMSKLTPEQLKEAAKTMAAVSPTDIDNAVEQIKVTTASNRGSSSDPMVRVHTRSSSFCSRDSNGLLLPNQVIDSLFRAAEFMSRPPTGGVDFRAFQTMAPIAALTGDRETDLAPQELLDCWRAGSEGSARVNRIGFGKVWAEVCDLFEGDIMDEARDPNSSNARAGVEETSSSLPPPSNNAIPEVGANLSPEQVRLLFGFELVQHP
jgi:hypothetical protein